MINYSSVLLFNAASYNPFFTVVGLLLGALSLGLGYGAVRTLTGSSAGTNASSRIIGVVVGLVLLVGAVLVLGLAALCAMWVAG